MRQAKSDRGTLLDHLGGDLDPLLVVSDHDGHALEIGLDGSIRAAMGMGYLLRAAGSFTGQEASSGHGFLSMISTAPTWGARCASVEHDMPHDQGSRISKSESPSGVLEQPDRPPTTGLPPSRERQGQQTKVEHGPGPGPDDTDLHDADEEV